jgi:hypothetical protein
MTILVLPLPLFSRDKIVKLEIFSLFKAKEEIFDVEKKEKERVRLRERILISKVPF